MTKGGERGGRRHTHQDNGHCLDGTPADARLTTNGDIHVRECTLANAEKREYSTIYFLV